MNQHWLVGGERGDTHFITLVVDLYTLPCVRQSDSLVNTLGEKRQSQELYVCVFVVEDGSKNWNRLGEKPVFPERIKNYLSLDHEISLQTRKAFKRWNHTRLQETCLDDSQWFWGETHLWDIKSEQMYSFHRRTGKKEIQKVWFQYLVRCSSDFFLFEGGRCYKEV